MKPDERFLNQPKHFWAHVRTISQQVGYTVRNTGQIKVPTLLEMKTKLRELGLHYAHVVGEDDRLTEFGEMLSAYFEHRAHALEAFVEPRLMDAARAKAEFDGLFARLSPKAPIPMNKQRGDKKAPAYLTAIVNMLIEANAEGLPCNYDPRELTTVTQVAPY